MSRETRPNRRSFMLGLTSLAGAAAVPMPALAEGAQTTSATPPWDLRWVDALKPLRHKQVFDMADTDPAGEPPPLRLPRNYLDAFRDVYALDAAAMCAVIGISGRAFAVNASDALWEKYALGERSKVVDPRTGKPAIRNIFLDEPTLGVRALQARGTIFWQCNIALNTIAQQLATPRQLRVDDVRAELLAGLNAGVRLVPSHVMALGMVQEQGATYVKI